MNKLKVIVIEQDGKEIKRYDITECQSIVG